jgi:hypothetical protein
MAPIGDGSLGRRRPASAERPGGPVRRVGPEEPHVVSQQIRSGDRGLTFRDHRGEDPVSDRAEAGLGPGVPSLGPEQHKGLMTVDELAPVRAVGEI